MKNATSALRMGMVLLLLGRAGPGRAESTIVPQREIEYSTMSWRVEDGLPFGEVRDIVQTPEGHLWAATLNGAVRFDGIQFETFDPQNTPELANPFINCLFADSRGRLWLGHQNGAISVKENGRFRAVKTPARWPQKEVDCFLEDADGEVWAVSLRGETIKVSTPTPEQPFVPALQNRPSTVQKHGSRVVMQALDGRIMEYRLDAMPLLHIEEGSYASPAPLATFAGSGTNDYWIILNQNQLKRLQAGKWIEDLGETTWLHKKKTILMESSTGKLHVGTPHGMYIYDRSGGYELLTEDNGLVNNQVLCLYEDREGTIWTGTGAGITAIRPSRYKTKYSAEQLKAAPIMAIAPKRDGGLWIGTYGQGLLSLEQHMFTIHDATFREIGTVMEASDGTVWFNCLNRFLAHYSKGKAIEVRIEPLNGREMNIIFEDGSGRMWAGGANGLFRRRPNKEWRKLPLPPSLIGAVRTMEEEPPDVFWIAREDGGLLRLDAGNRDRVEREEGLANESVHALLHEKDHERLWIGTSGGLAMKSAGRIVSFTEQDGLPGNVISTILDDGTGRLWLQTNRGIAVVEKQQLMEVAEHRAGQLSPLLLDASDGFTLPGMGERIQTSCRTGDGHLWFVTAEGLIELDPANVHQSREPVPLWFAQMQANDRIIPLENGRPPKLSPGVYRFNVSYSALSFNAPHRIRFKYRLMGYDENWIDAGTRRRAEYHRLPPGHYRLELLACNGDGYWNPEPAVLPFTIPPFFWETGGFKSLMVILGILLSVGLGLAIADRFNRRRLIRVEKLRAVEQERSRISMDIHDEIGAGLTRVTLLSGLVDRIAKKWDPPEALSQNLREMERESGKLVRSLDEIVWMISPGNDTLQNLCAYLEKFTSDYLEKTDIRCKLDIPFELPGWNIPGPVRHSLFLLVKESLNNIVKHAQASEVTLGISAENNRLKITVHDNGKGMDNHADSRFSHGIKGMHKRMEQMGGTFDIQSDPALGTTVCLSLDKHHIHM